MEIENNRILEISNELDNDNEIQISIDDTFMWVTVEQAKLIIEHLKTLTNH